MKSLALLCRNGSSGVLIFTENFVLFSTVTKIWEFIDVPEKLHLKQQKNIITLFYTFAEKIFEMLHICDNFFLLQICYAPTNDDNGNSNSDYGQVKLGQAPMGANLYICDKNVNF